MSSFFWNEKAKRTIGPLGFNEQISISLLFKFAGAIVIPVVAVVIIPLLEFLIALAASTIIIEVLAIAFPSLIGPEALHVWGIGELQLAVGEVGKLALDRVVVYRLFVPVVIRQFHIVGDGIGEAIALFRVLFGQRLVDDDLQVLSEMGELGIAFGIFQRFGTCAQGFPCGNGIRRGNFQLEVGDQE